MLELAEAFPESHPRILQPRGGGGGVESKHIRRPGVQAPSAAKLDTARSDGYRDADAVLCVENALLKGSSCEEQRRSKYCTASKQVDAIIKEDRELRGRHTGIVGFQHF